MKKKIGFKNEIKDDDVKDVKTDLGRIKISDESDWKEYLFEFVKGFVIGYTVMSIMIAVVNWIIDED